MIKVARKVSSEVRPAIERQQADATDIPLPDGGFDIVFCQQALQFFPDRLAALGEMHRVLAPNGRLALSACVPPNTTHGTHRVPLVGRTG